MSRLQSLLTVAFLAACQQPAYYPDQDMSDERDLEQVMDYYPIGKPNFDSEYFPPEQLQEGETRYLPNGCSLSLSFMRLGNDCGNKLYRGRTAYFTLDCPEDNGMSTAFYCVGPPHVMMAITRSRNFFQYFPSEFHPQYRKFMFMIQRNGDEVLAQFEGQNL
jgi:hypothetical protein